MMREYNVSGIPIVEDSSRSRLTPPTRSQRMRSNGKPPAIAGHHDPARPEISGRRQPPDRRRDDRENLVTAPENTTLDEAERILYRAKVEKLLLIDKENRLAGLITMRDIDKLHQFPHACKDRRGRLRVGAATGVKDFARVEALIKADVDVVVVDTGSWPQQERSGYRSRDQKELQDPGDCRQYCHGRRGQGS